MQFSDFPLNAHAAQQFDRISERLRAPTRRMVARRRCDIEAALGEDRGHSRWKADDVLSRSRAADAALRVNRLYLG